MPCTGGMHIAEYTQVWLFYQQEGTRKETGMVDLASPGQRQLYKTGDHQQLVKEYRSTETSHCKYYPISIKRNVSCIQKGIYRLKVFASPAHWGKRGQLMVIITLKKKKGAKRSLKNSDPNPKSHLLPVTADLGKGTGFFGGTQDTSSCVYIYICIQ